MTADMNIWDDPAILAELGRQVVALVDGKLQKEKNEGEKEKRDLPPTPPIERKAKEGEEKKDISLSACAREKAIRETDERLEREKKEAEQVFESFWAKYPAGRKVAKRKCREKVLIHYKTARDKSKFVNELLGGLDRWLASRTWGNGCVCNPETFLNQERWLDTPEPSRASLDEAKEAEDRRANDESAEILKGLGL